MTTEMIQPLINGLIFALSALVVIYTRFKYIRRFEILEMRFIMDLLFLALALLFIWAALTAFLNPIYYIKYL